MRQDRVPLRQRLERVQHQVKLFTDTVSGSTTERPGLTEALAYARAGDTLVVWRLDRLGRSLKHLIETVTALDSRGIGFKSLTEQIDTTTPGGKLVFHIFGALTEFERDLIRERTQAGLGVAGGRRHRAFLLSAMAVVRSAGSPSRLSTSRHRSSGG